MNSPLVYAPKISKYYNKNVWLKLEILNPTGSHKDRESLKLIKEAKKKKFRSIGCASTGNLAISLAFFSKIYKINSKIWLRNQDIDIYNFNLIKSLGAKVYLKKTADLAELYDLSSRIMNLKKIFNANPNNSKLKILANTEIIKEIYKLNKQIDTFVTCINNGSHLLGLTKGLKIKHHTYGIFSKSKLAKSINPFTQYEKKNLIEYLNIDEYLIEARDNNIRNGYKLLGLEGISCEPSSAAVVGSLSKINKKNICCIITGTIHKNLQQFQNILINKNLKLNKD